MNPREVVTLLLDDVDAPMAELVAAMGIAGLDELAHAQPVGAPWPTLAAMIASGKRLVVLARDPADALADGGARPDWYHSLTDHARETARASSTVQELVTCALTDADAGARSLTLVHEYLASADAGPAPESVAASVNALATLTSTRTHCQEQGAFVTFLAVDFFETADARNFVSEANDADAGRP